MATMAPAKISGASTVAILNFEGLVTFFRFGILTVSDSGMSAARGGRLKGAVRLGVRLGSDPARGARVSVSCGRTSNATPPA